MRNMIAAFAFVTATSVAALAAGSADDVLKANKAATGGAAWDAKAAASIEGDYSGQGMTGTTHSLNDLKDGRSANEFKVGPAVGGNGFDGTTPWMRDTSGTITEQKGGDAVVVAINDAYRNANKWWLADHGGATIASKGEVADPGGRYDVLSVTPKLGKPFEAWFDTKTHYLVKTVEVQGSQNVTTLLSDYRPEAGVVIPHKIVIDTGMGEKYLQTIRITKVEFLPAQPATAFVAPKLAVTDFSIAGGAAETTVPVQIVNNHIFGEAKVNGQGPFTFIFDTGGHNIITPPVTKQLGLKVEGSLAGGGAGEGVMEGGYVNGVEFAVGKASVKNQLAIVFPLDRLGEIEGVPLPGMVGYETFRRFVTRIDYGAGTLTLIDPAKFDPKDAGTPVKFEFNEHVPEVAGTFEGIPAKFDIDTGSRAEITVNKPFAEKNGLRASHPKGVDAVEGWGVGGPSTGYVMRASELTLGTVKVGPVVASLSDQSKGAFSGSDFSGNVGGGVLKRFTVTFDYNNKVMYLKPRTGPISDTGTFDRTGLWINVGGGGFIVVSLTKGAPAEQAGLKKDDIIVAVDGAPTGSLTLGDLRKRLRNDAPGTVVTFKVNRGGTLQDIKVTLRDLI
ncbi:MAG: aspartyl protease family protein [Rhizomicrobium sp.]|nr:aspartyl protease family protein [Rhizomicrobium sp.]